MAPRDALDPEDEDLNAVASHCPRCNAEYRPGFDTCADCGIALVPGPAPRPPEDERTPPSDPHEPAIEVARVCSLALGEAQLLVGRLRSDGIPARMYPDFFSSASPIFPRSRRLFGRTGSEIVDIIVPREWLDEARAVADRYVRR